MAAYASRVRGVDEELMALCDHPKLEIGCPWAKVLG